MPGSNYDQLYLHRLMLRDVVRDQAFKDSLKACVKPDSVVLDVGAGTGFLSLLAAQDGAQKVYAVEPTEMAQVMQETIAANEFANRIEVIEGRIEDVPVKEKVDVVVFEWLSAGGNDENMYRHMLLARDRWLKPDGVLIPGNVTTWMAPAHDELLSQEREFFMKNPFGLNLEPIWRSTSEEVFYARHHVKESHLLAAPSALWTYDVRRDSWERANQKYQANPAFSVTKAGTFNCLATWFTADMPGTRPLTNSPDSADTHWGRVIFPCQREYQVKIGDLIEVRFTAEPGGDGWCRGSWSARIGGSEWEHHLDHKST